jgi:hypothetical protein
VADKEAEADVGDDVKEPLGLLVENILEYASIA